MILENRIKPSRNSISKRPTLLKKNTLVEDMEGNVECAGQISMRESKEQSILFSKEVINTIVSINFMSNQTLLSNDFINIYIIQIFNINNSQ